LRRKNTVERTIEIKCRKEMRETSYIRERGRVSARATANGSHEEAQVARIIAIQGKENETSEVNDGGVQGQAFS
jgi:hypothetical protein